MNYALDIGRHIVGDTNCTLILPAALCTDPFLILLGTESRILVNEDGQELPMWNMVEIEFPIEGFFPDMLCSPCIMVARSLSDKCRFNSVGNRIVDLVLDADKIRSGYFCI